MRRRFSLLVVTVALLATCAATGALAAPTVLVGSGSFGVVGPRGVAVADDGSVFVSSPARLAKYAPNGFFIKEATYTGPGGKLTIDPKTGAVWSLMSDGQLATFDPTTLARTDIGNLKSLTWAQNNVLNTNGDTVQDLSSLFSPGDARTEYGDIALLRRGTNDNQVRIFVTAISNIGTVPWVGRLTFDTTVPNPLQGAQALVIAAAERGNSDHFPRGIAVDGNGGVFMNLPRPNFAIDGPDLLYAVNQAWPDGFPPPGPLSLTIDFFSRGMTVDGNGTVYATGPIGSQFLCGNDGAGAVMYLRYFGGCQGWGLFFPIQMEDVAVSSNGGQVYTASPGGTFTPPSVYSWGRLVTYHQLTLTKSGSGDGTFTTTPSALFLRCSGQVCTGGVAVSTEVTFQANPAAGSTFTGWSGDCSGTDACTVTMNAAKSVTATFTGTTTTRQLNVSKAGSGSGSVTSTPAGIDCGATCSASFNNGAQVTLQASPKAGSTFASWSGACSGTGSCTVTMDSATSVTATFALTPGQPAPPSITTPSVVLGSPVQPDRLAPVPVLSGPTSARLKDLQVVVRMNEAGTVKVKGTVSVPGASRVYRFKTAVRQVAAGAQVRIPIKLGKKAAGAVKRALKKRKKAVAKLTLVVTDTSGNSGTHRRSIRLKR
jgi:hypothetical protein